MMSLLSREATSVCTMQQDSTRYAVFFTQCIAVHSLYRPFKMRRFTQRIDWAHVLNHSQLHPPSTLTQICKT